MINRVPTIQKFMFSPTGAISIFALTSFASGYPLYVLDQKITICEKIDINKTHACLSLVYDFRTFSYVVAFSSLLISLFYAAIFLKTQWKFEIRRHKTKNRIEKDFRPPSFSEVVIMMLAKSEVRLALIGDLEQQFKAQIVKFGLRRARWLYRSDMLRSIGPLLWQATKRLGIAALAVAGLKKWIGL